jgi:hypothetical protein
MGRTRNDHVGREGAGARRAIRVIVDLQSEEIHIVERCRGESPQWTSWARGQGSAIGGSLSMSQGSICEPLSGWEARRAKRLESGD